MKNIVITGGAGFIDSHVVRLFVNKYPENEWRQPPYTHIATKDGKECSGVLIKPPLLPMVGEAQTK